MLLELVDKYQKRLGFAEVKQHHWRLSNELAQWQNTAQILVPISRDGTIYCCRLTFDKGRRTRMAYEGVKDVKSGMSIRFFVGDLKLDIKVWRDSVQRGTVGHGEAIKTTEV